MTSEIFNSTFFIEHVRANASGKLRLLYSSMKIHQTKPFHNCTITIILNGNVSSTQRRIQRDLEVGIPVWAPKLGAQKSFLVQYISSSIHGDK